MSNFTIYPALDLRCGQIVRLKQGDPGRQTTYDRYPGQVARRWLKTGARWLHVVNLDGAFGEEESSNLEGLRQILDQARPLDASIQFGGGIRSLDNIESLLSLGVKRVILGTAAAQNPDLVQEAVTLFSAQRIAVGVDVQDDVVRVRGWTEDTDLAPITFGNILKKMGLVWAIYTDIQRDGLAKGLNIPATRHFQEDTGLKVIAAGGVASLNDIRKARKAGLSGSIIGRALYEGEVVPDPGSGDRQRRKIDVSQTHHPLPGH